MSHVVPLTTAVPGSVSAPRGASRIVIAGSPLLAVGARGVVSVSHDRALMAAASGPPGQDALVTTCWWGASPRTVTCKLREVRASDRGSSPWAASSPSPRPRPSLVCSVADMGSPSGPPAPQGRKPALFPTVVLHGAHAGSDHDRPSVDVDRESEEVVTSAPGARLDRLASNLGPALGAHPAARSRITSCASRHASSLSHGSSVRARSRTTASRISRIWVGLAISHQTVATAKHRGYV